MLESYTRGFLYFSKFQTYPSKWTGQLLSFTVMKNRSVESIQGCILYFSLIQTMSQKYQFMPISKNIPTKEVFVNNFLYLFLIRKKIPPLRPIPSLAKQLIHPPSEKLHFIRIKKVLCNMSNFCAYVQKSNLNPQDIQRVY